MSDYIKDNRGDLKRQLISLLDRLENNEEPRAFHIQSLKDIIECFGDGNFPLQAYYSLEDWLNKQDKPIEIQSAMIWGGLWVLKQMGCIKWEDMKSIYGEFMSKKMNVR